jgi:hypothetical protein
MDIRRATDVDIVPGPSGKEFDLAQTQSQGDKHAVRTVEETNV